MKLPLQIHVIMLCSTKKRSKREQAWALWKSHRLLTNTVATVICGYHRPMKYHAGDASFLKGPFLLKPIVFTGHQRYNGLKNY